MRLLGRRTFEWALLLPLAMPAYIVAYAYTDYLQYAGPLQTRCETAFNGSAATTGFPRFDRSEVPHPCSSSSFIRTCTCWHALRFWRARRR